MSGSLAVVVAVRMIAMMMVVMGMTMVAAVTMAMIMSVFDRGFAFTTSAYGTHYSTSNSLIRISSPAFTCN